MFSLRRLIAEGLRQHWRIHAAVAMAVVAATAVLTGALVVGDSVRGSLRALALDRLGEIDEVIVADRFFRTSLADELKAEPKFSEAFSDALPAILVQGTVESTKGDHQARAGKVTVLGVEDMFWSLGDGGPTKPLDDSHIVLNQPLADELHAAVGDDIILRIGQASQIPADSPLGRKTDSVRNRRLTVAEIIPARGLGRFGLRPNQQLPLNAFVATGTLQTMLEQPEKVNAIIVAGGERETASDAETLSTLLHPTLADLGLQLERTSLGYFNLTSTRMLLDPVVEKKVRHALAGHEMQTALTYLANYIKVADGKARIPYSTISAVESVPDDGAIADDEIVLNRWAADDFAKQGVELKPGDTVTIEYFEPESTHGEVRERTATFRLKAIAEMTPAVADRNFTPELPGVTDQKSIANWDPPFPYDDTRVRSRKPHDEDEAYWDEYKATPKAFVSLNRGRELWGSRFGDATSIRIAAKEGGDVASLDASLLRVLKPEDLGYQFLPVKAWALAASSGTTPFNALFLGSSFFIVASAVMLLALLFRLGVEQRAREVGVLAAVGFRWRRIAKLLAGESLVMTVFGGLVGAALGVGYAWLMIYGLKTWWVAAIRTPFLDLHVTAASLLVGFASGVLVALLTIVWTLWRMRTLAVRQLLAGNASDPLQIGYVRGSSLRKWIAIAALLVALALGFAGNFALRSSNQMVASGMFFGSGALALVGVLTLVGARLRSAGSRRLVTGAGLPLARLAARNAARNPRRSSLTIGLVASATFLIVAISAFRLDPAKEQLGSGGFALIAESSQPIYKDIGSEGGRADLGFSAKEDAVVKSTKVFSLRVQPGDDASCLNLYQTTQPRAVGIPQSFIERGQFGWAGTLAESSEEKENPWLLLDRSDGEAIPIVLDANTAMYSLHKGLGDVLELTDGRSQPMKAQIVGLLANSIFQGDMLMSEKNLLARFPDVNGYRMFLVETSADNSSAVQTALETVLGDYGFDAERTSDRLASFFAVQNTYLSTFQSLGGLGLLLGTFGLAAVQLRNVLERRGELALLRATGFSRRKLANLVMLENGVLLLGGMVVGVGTALIAVLPHWLNGEAQAPWQPLATTLLAVAIVGLVAGSLATRSTLRAPLTTALRGD